MSSRESVARPRATFATNITTAISTLIPTAGFYLEVSFNSTGAHMRRRQTLLLLSLLPMLTQVQGEPTEPALAKAAKDPSVQWGPCPAFMPKGCGLAVLHGDPARPNADVFLKIPAKADLPHHTHSSAERMVLVAGELTVKYDGQPAAKLRPGTYAYGPAKLGHSATCTSTDECVLFIAFEGPVDAIPSGQPKK